MSKEAFLKATNHITSIENKKNSLLNVITERENHMPLNDRIIDVHFQKLIEHPIDVVSTTFEQLGISFTKDTQTKITNYLIKKPRNKFGNHNYTPAEFNLSENSIRKYFRDYIEYYGILPET